MKFDAHGDTHGKFDRLPPVLPDRPALILGDVGLFNEEDILPEGYKFFRGNHDNPKICKAHPANIGDYGMWNKCFFAAGADSIDKKWRTPGVDWWPDEQMEYVEMQLCVEQYEKVKPNIMLSHEAPYFLHKLLKAAAVTRSPENEGWGEPQGNATASMLDQMYKIHQPKLWVFGHWHVGLTFNYRMRDPKYLGSLAYTHFVCLDELTSMTIETDDYA